MRPLVLLAAASVGFGFRPHSARIDASNASSASRSARTHGTRLEAADAHEADRDGHGHHAGHSNGMGTLACMRWTGGTCHTVPCSGKHGSTVCEEGFCMCAEEKCADGFGRCVPGSAKWLGTYSIKFQKPNWEAEPYLGVSRGRPSWEQDGWAGLALQASAARKWQVAVTTAGYVRLTHVDYPASALNIRHNRSSRLPVPGGSAAHSSAELSVSVRGRAAGWGGSNAQGHREEDLRPLLVNLDKVPVSPTQVTFQLTPSDDGKLFELWSPGERMSLACVSGRSQERSSSVVVSCDADTPGHVAENCYDRQLVSFDPPLPFDAQPRDLKVQVAHTRHFAICFVLAGWVLIISALCCFEMQTNAVAKRVLCARGSASRS